MPQIKTFGANSARSLGLFASVDDRYWAATLGSGSNEYGRAVAIDASSNLYAAGYATASNFDVLVAKYNSAGAIQWQRTLSTANNDVGLGVTADASGNVYVTGYVGTGASTTDILVAKYNASGTLQWQRKLGGAGNQQGNAIAVDAAGSVYITGTTDSSRNMVLAKYNTSGVLQWQKVFYYSLPTYNEGFGVTLDSSGNIYVVGATEVTAGGEIFIAKLDSSAVIQWQRTLGGSGADFGTGIAVDAATNVYIAGYTRNVSTGRDQMLVAKYNPSGSLLWQQTLSSGSGNLTANSVSVDVAGRVYVTSRTSPTNALTIASYDTTGVLLWQRSFGGGSVEENAQIAVAPLGTMSIAATSNSAGAGARDMLLVRLPGNGTRLGTYGPWTYQTASYTSAASSLTTVSSSLLYDAGTLTDAAAGMTGATSTYTSTVTTI